MRTKIVLADDHPVVRQRLRGLIELYPGFAVIGEAADGEDAVRQVVQLCPDVIVLDLAQPKQASIQTARLIHELRPITQIIILSMYAINEDVVQALKVGVQGYLLKESAGSELIEAIKTVHAKSFYVSPKLLRHLGSIFIRSMLA